MKKTLLFVNLVWVVVLLTPVPHALAQTATDNCLNSATYACSEGEVCKGSPIPTCQKNSAACSPACTGDKPVCNSGVCEAASQYTNGATTQSTTGGTARDAGFIPLSQSPLTQYEQGEGDLPGFFNRLYDICIGIAIVLAVLQLMRAGIMYMGGDSITNKEQARHLIQTSILGLLLVLAPVIVFGIINKDILNFNLNLDALRVKVAPSTTAGNGAGDTGSQSGNTGDGDSGSQTGSSGAPQNLHVTSKTDSSATLAWSPPADASKVAKYNVYKNGALTKIVPADQTSVTITGLTKDESAAFTVTAVDSAGTESATSNSETVTVQSETTDGSEGAWVASGFVFVADNGLNAPPVNCWNFGAHAYGVPLGGKTKVELQQLCNADQTKNDSTERDFQCVFVSPGSTFTPPSAPGTVCHPYTCSAYTAGNLNWTPCTLH